MTNTRNKSDDSALWIKLQEALNKSKNKTVLYGKVSGYIVPFYLMEAYDYDNVLASVGIKGNEKTEQFEIARHTDPESGKGIVVSIPTPLTIHMKKYRGVKRIVSEVVSSGNDKIPTEREYEKMIDVLPVKGINDFIETFLSVGHERTERYELKQSENSPGITVCKIQLDDGIDRSSGEQGIPGWWEYIGVIGDGKSEKQYTGDSRRSMTLKGTHTMS